MYPIKQVKTNRPPREILAEHFELLELTGAGGPHILRFQGSVFGAKYEVRRGKSGRKAGE